MGFFSKTPPPEDDLDEDYVAPEVLALRRRKRLWLILLGLTVLAAVTLGVAARPLGRAIKGWQAERAARAADVFIEKKDLKSAQKKVQDALALSPMNKLAMRSAARFLTRAGSNADAVAFWKKVADRLPLEAADERLFASALLGTGDFAGARTHLQKVWPEGTEGTPEDWVIGLPLAMQTRNEAEAIRLADKLMSDEKAPAGQRLQAASFICSTSDDTLRARAWKTIEIISQGQDDAGLQALIALGRRCAALKNNQAAENGIDPTPDWMRDPDKLAEALEAHPKADAKVKLFAVDLRLVGDPLKKDALIAEATEKLSQTDTDLESLTAWLYGKGEFRKALKLLPEDVALRRKSLFLQRLDIMAAMGQWQEVRDTIQQSRFSLDRVTSELYVARCDEQLGSLETSAVHWRTALDAAGSDLGQLNTIANYALKSGKNDIAEAAVHAIIAAEPKARGSYDLLLQVYQARRDTMKLNELFQKMAGQWPSDEAIQNDLAYSNLLLKRDTAGASQMAADLFEKSPKSLPHRITLALARYETGDYAEGLAMLQNIQGDTAPLTGRMSAIKAALLWELGRKGEAAVAMDAVKPEELLPEEKQLIAPVLRSMGL